MLSAPDPEIPSRSEFFQTQIQHDIPRRSCWAYKTVDTLLAIGQIR